MAGSTDATIKREEELVQRYRKPVYGYLVRCGVSEGDRDDVFSRGFICPKGSTLKQLDADPDRVGELSLPHHRGSIKNPVDVARHEQVGHLDAKVVEIGLDPGIE